MRALGTARQGLHQGQTVFEMRFGLLVGALVEGVLARTLPVGNGLGRAAGRCGMMRDELGLGGDDLGELLLQDLDQALVVVLPCLLQQGLIGSILNERVFKDIRCLWRHTPLVDDLGLHQPRQLLPQGDLINMRHGPQ